MPKRRMPVKRPTGEQGRTEIKNLLRVAREEAGLSQADLASLSRASTRTINRLEGDQRTARPAAIVRLAVALGQDVGKWLAAAGHSKLAVSSVQRLVEEATSQQSTPHNVLDASHHVDLSTYFHTIAKRSEISPLLMCICYTSPPRALKAMSVMDDLVKALQQQMWMAMCCPYIPPDQLSSNGRPSLVNFHREVIAGVALLADELRQRISKNADRIRIFVPNEDPHVRRIHFTTPPGMPLEVRSFLVKTATSSALADHEYELVAWMDFSGTTKDRLIKFSGGDRAATSEVSLHAIRVWRDYFKDIVLPWHNTQGQSWGEPNDQTIWRGHPLQLALQ